jgi:hypothetical protein
MKSKPLHLYGYMSNKIKTGGKTVVSVWKRATIAMSGKIIVQGNKISTILCSYIHQTNLCMQNSALGTIANITNPISLFQMATHGQLTVFAHTKSRRDNLVTRGF